jgi:hypothetical protein
MMTWLQQEVVEKEKNLEGIQPNVQKHRGARKNFISIADSSTMTEATLVCSSFIDTYQEHLGESYQRIWL